jgi:hypothetical protein
MTDIDEAPTPVLPRELTSISDEVRAVGAPPTPELGEPYSVRLADEPFRSRRRRHQKDSVQIVSLRHRKPLRGLIRNQIGRNHPQPARRSEVACKRVDTPMQHEIPVRHHHSPAPRVTDRLDCGQRVTHPNTAAQRRFGGRRDRRAVHTGVRVRNTHLDQIAAGFDQRRHRRDRGRHIGKACRQVANQRRAVLRPARVEQPRQPAHESPSIRPNHFAAVSTSLSPRPDRLTRMMALEPSS